MVQKPLSTTPRAGETVVVLTVSPLKETHAKLRGIFAHTNWTMLESQDSSHAMELLRSHSLPVVICERDLDDGSWSDLLEQVAKLPAPPLIVVTAGDADELLWGEVLNLGGYDVLPKPLEASEVTRVVSLAWMHWRQKWSVPRRAAGAAGASTLLAALA